jgi:hypothetical protein
VSRVEVTSYFCVDTSGGRGAFPIGVPVIKHHYNLYVDDVILFVSTASDARVISRILDIFGNASGLSTSPDKCSITTTFGDEDVLHDFVCHAMSYCGLSNPLSGCATFYQLSAKITVHTAN